MLPDGGKEGYKAGDTTIRAGFQYTFGDRAFDGDRELLNPPAQADIDYARQLWTLEIYTQVSTQVGIGVALPYYEQDVKNRALGTSNHEAGIGDIAGYVMWSPWAREDAERRLLGAEGVTWLLGVSLPTGDDLAGELPGLHSYHLGSGSAEFKIGGRYLGWATEELQVFVGAVAIIDGGENRTGFKYGNSTDIYFGAGYRFHESISAWASIDVITREKDTVGTLEIDDSGGIAWYLEVGLAGRITPAWAVEAAVDIPIFMKVHGIQPVPTAIVGVGVRYRF